MTSRRRFQLARQRGAVLLLAATFSLLTVPLARSAQAPPPGLGIRLTEAPTNRADDPRARVYIVDRVAPGARLSRRIEVSNGSSEPMDVRLYPATATVSGGSFAVADAGVPGEVPSWTTVTPASVRLAPGGRAQAEVVIQVDPHAAPGEYYGGVVAERPAAASSGGVGVNLRVAIRIYLSVGPGGEPASNFTIDTLTAGRSTAGAPMVTAQVHNTGGRALDMSGTLRLADGPGGLSAGPFNATLGTTLGIGQTEPVTVPLDKALPAGPWKATLELQSGLVRRTATASITFPDAPGAQAAPVKAVNVPLAKDRKVLIPIAGALIGVLALLLLVSGLISSRRKGRARAAGQ